MAHSAALATLGHLFFYVIESRREECLLAWTSGVWSTERFALGVYRLNRWFAAQGLQPGDRVGILSENRPEWHIADFASLLGRYLVVPIYPTLAQAQVHHLLSHSGCRALVLSNQKQWDMVEPLLQALPELRHIVSMDQIEGVEGLPHLMASSGEPQWDEVRAAALAADPDETATIVYTSGTTGTPKGVMLSHANIVFDYERCIERLGRQGVEQALSILPLSHVLERLLCYAYFRLGIRIAYGDPFELRDLLKRYRPEAVGCVPRVLERIREAVETQIRTLPAWKQALSAALMESAILCDKLELASEQLSAGDRFRRTLARALVYPKIRRQLGGVRFLVCGGAWLDPEVEHFFRAAGFTVLQGYGLTETSPVVCLSHVDRQRPGTVGPPLDGVEIRIGRDDEILVRGANVMKGYYRDSVGTSMAFEDGWLRTGDTGRIDKEGNLAITGRCKEILVLSTGKNVSCALIEQALLRSQYIQNCFVVGDGQKFLSALIVPHRASVERYTASRRTAVPDYYDLLVTAEVIELFQREIEAQQASLAHYEQVKRFCYLREEALLDNELMTPTQKVRRNVLGRKFAPWIQQMMEQTKPVVIPFPPAAPAAVQAARQGQSS